MKKYSSVVSSTCFVLFITVTLSLLSSCAEERFKATTTLEGFQRNATFQVASGVFSRQTVSGKNLAIDDSGSGDYLLGAGDLLKITVLESEEMNAEVRVSARGEISLPLIGTVNVLNKTTAEVEQDIEDRYAASYIHNPHVSVYIEQHLSKQITLVGAVYKPGTYEYISQKRLLDVLALGGGLTEDAGAFAFLSRRDPKTGKVADYQIDMDKLVKDGDMSVNYIVRGGDVLFIPEAGKFFIDGAVRKPGTYAIRDGMTVTEAIVQAGGLAGYADKDAIKLVRFMGRGQEREIVSLAYNDLQAGLGDTLFLKDQDIIYAESSATGKILSGSGVTLGILGTGVSFRDPEK